MFFRNRCYNGGNQHKFEPRYDENSSFPKIDMQGYAHPNQLQAFRTISRTYVKDVCIWCGKEIRK